MTGLSENHFKVNFKDWDHHSVVDCHRFIYWISQKVQVFNNTLWKNPNELFGQPTFLLSE